jgi:hypothetical protein
LRELQHMAEMAPRARGQLDVLRWRHALADEARDRRRDPRSASAATGQIQPGCEITLEANPTSVEAGRFAGYRAAGVNRVSLGVQSLVEADLKALGRMHDGGRGTGRGFDRGKALRAHSRSISSTPAPTRRLKPGGRSLSRRSRHAPTHLSLYQLTIENGTAFQGDS